MSNKTNDNVAKTKPSRKPYQELTFTDNYMFCRIMESDMELSRQLLEVVLDSQIREVKLADAEHTISINSDIKSVRLDVYLDDEAGTVYDLEMQTSNKKEIPRRSRYYHSITDIDYLRSGGDYEDLPTSYVIFLCTFDPFGKGLPRYEFRSLCKEDTDVELDDGQRSVFINAKSNAHDMPQELRSLLDYMCGDKPSSDLTRSIAESIINAKTNKRWERGYMFVSDIIKEERQEGFKQGLEQGLEQGMKRGVEEGRINNAVRVVDNLVSEEGLSFERACALSSISEEEYHIYKNQEHNE